MLARCLLFLCMLFALSTITGCGGGKGDVTGKVTLEDRSGTKRPVASGSVMIIGGDGLPYRGPIQEDGSFTIAAVPIGEARATVTSPDPRGGSAKGATKGRRGDPEAGSGMAVGSSRGKDISAADLQKWFPIPGRYGDLETSGLTLKVVAGANTFDILLEEPSQR